MAAKKITLNELRSLVKRIIKEESNSTKLPVGVIIDTTKTTQTKQEILEMYHNEGFTSINGNSLISNSFQKYDREKDVYILVGKLLDTPNLQAIKGDYLGENQVATQNFIPKIPNLRIITNLP